MKFIFTSYVSSPEYDRPELWLHRIEAYTGILENLSKTHSVIGIERINYEGELLQNGVHYHFIKLRKKVVWFPWKMHSLVKRLQPDVVFINGLIFPLQIIQLRLRLGKKAKIIVLHRAEKPFTGIKKYLQKYADKYVAAYLFASSVFSDHWQQNIDIRKVHEVMQASSVFHPVDKMDSRKQTGIDGHPVFLWVGRLDANKDPLTVIRAFLQFMNNQPLAKLYMIYQDEQLLSEVSHLLKTDDLAKGSVILLGRVSHHQMQVWYNSADFFISGSYYEGSGVSVLESMSCGCIPVVTDIPSFRKMTGQGKYGLLFKPGNEEDLLAALMKTKEMNRKIVSEKVIEQFNNELSFEAIANKINTIVNYA